MKYHKIRNVPLEVCTAEAKIAYNLASSLPDNYRYTYRERAHLYSAIAVSEFISEAMNMCLNRWIKSRSYQENPNKYNIDAIQCCLRFGLEEYFKNDSAILWTYKEVGEIFKSLYLNKK